MGERVGELREEKFLEVRFERSRAEGQGLGLLRGQQDTSKFRIVT